MTNEEKQILLKDLCARLPYGVKVQIKSTYTDEYITVFTSDLMYLIGVKSVKPYLRPMSSMTKEEKLVYEQRLHDVGRSIDVIDADDVVSHIDWLLSHHFDYRGLIPMGLALEAPEDMYGEN